MNCQLSTELLPPLPTSTPAPKTGAGVLSDCQKSLAEFAASAAKKFQIVFDRGVYVGENTSQAASVEFVRLWRTNYARSRLQNWRKSPKGFFDKLQRRSVFQEIFYVQTIHLFPRAQA